jgi:hypothetical protein
MTEIVKRVSEIMTNRMQTVGLMIFVSRWGDSIDNIYFEGICFTMTVGLYFSELVNEFWISVELEKRLSSSSQKPIILCHFCLQGLFVLMTPSLYSF